MILNNDLNNQVKKDLEHLLAMQKRYNFQVSLIEAQLTEIIEDYNQLTRLSSLVIKDISKDKNAFSYSKIIARLIKDGYLSFRRQYKPTNDSRKFKIACHYYGLDLIRGYGCCRHVAHIHQTVFKHLNAHSNFLFVLVGMEKNSNPKSDFQVDHLVNTIEYDNVFYAHDAYNDIFYRFCDPLMLMPYSNDKAPHVLFNKPYNEIIYCNKNPIEVLKDMKTLYENSKKEMISSKELAEIIRQTNEDYDNNRKLLVDFAHEIKPYVKRINKGLKKRKP